MVKTKSLLILSLLLVLSSPFAAFAESPQTLDLSQYKGQFVYLDFWASWCGPCRASFPWMNALKKDLQDKGLMVVSVNLDANRDDADEFLSKFPADFEVIFDPSGKEAEKYKLLGMPNSFFFDREGKLLFTHIGFNEKDSLALRKKIEAHINQPTLHQISHQVQ
jgi:cytochrome c biogenesis protein CcmG, thiol:disulfide interchange protein DsbE